MKAPERNIAMTEKLYYIDSLMHEFDATVISCEEGKNCWLITLDRTAFFPEGGGQYADTGYIGNVRISDVQEKDGRIIHYAAAPLTVGETYPCRIDYEQRLRRMQAHSGEHIVSGITHNLYGLDNVGFHMGDEGIMTIDFNGELEEEQLALIEKRANEAVRANLPILCTFPDSETLAAMDYRSKLELTENVRIVEIEGIDRCACCAPHMKYTGQIGLIKLIEHTRHRGGVRVTLACGMDAVGYVNQIQSGAFAVSRLLSAKRHEIAKAVERVLNEQLKAKERIGELSMALAREKAAKIESTEGNICVFDNVLDEVALRELVNMLSQKCGGFAAAFSGDDEAGYRYIIGSRHLDLRAASKQINAAIGGRGGGSTEMIQGRANSSAALIQSVIFDMTV